MRTFRNELHTPNHTFYEQYYVDQAKKKGGNLTAFHGARFQRGYGLGSIFRGLFRRAMPHLQQGTKVIGEKALQTSVQVAQDFVDEHNIKTAVRKRTKQALGLPSQNSSQEQSGACKKATKRKAQPRYNSSPPDKKAKTSPQKRKAGKRNLTEFFEK